MQCRTDETVVLGATHQWGDWNTSPSAEDRKRILENCYKLVPAMKVKILHFGFKSENIFVVFIFQAAPIVSEWVGLRPYRHCVRLEAEKRRTMRGQERTVSEFGH
jgi:hypothetical protein